MENFLKRLPIAHRGLHGEFPENTLPAFVAAERCGYAIETDVRFTKDKVLVVFHDDTLARLAGDERRVEECTLSELKEVKIGGEKIPTLAEMLHAVKSPLLIEIKHMAGVKGKEVAAALAAEMRGFAAEYAVQSFDPLYVRAYKTLCPNVPCGVLGTANREDFGKGMKESFRAKIVKNCPPSLSKGDFVSYRREDLPSPVLKKYPLRLAWVVRSPEEESLTRPFVDNIIFENYLPEIL